MLTFNTFSKWRGTWQFGGRVVADSNLVTGYVDGAAAGTNLSIVYFVILNIFYKKKNIGD